MLTKERQKMMKEIVKRNTRYLRYIKRFPEFRDENGFVCIRQAIPKLSKEEFNTLKEMCQKKKIIFSECLDQYTTGLHKFKLKA